MAQEELIKNKELLKVAEVANPATMASLTEIESASTKQAVEAEIKIKEAKTALFKANHEVVEAKQKVAQEKTELGIERKKKRASRNC